MQKDTDNAFTLGDTTTTYSSIEDIFAVFDYETLNLFEKEFLDFSKSIYDIDIVDDAAQISLLGLDYQDENTQFRNFQVLFRQLMEVPPNSTKLDLYEFLYSPSSIDLKIVLKCYEHENLLHINWVHFGSSNFDKQYLSKYFYL